MRRLILVSFLLFSLPLAARAADQTILGKQISLKNPSTPEKRKILVKASETASPNTLVGDPTVTGATLLIGVYGSTASAETYTLSAGLNLAGKPFWKGDATKGFKYADKKGENGPVKAAQIKKTAKGVFKIKAIISGKTGTVSVVPPNVGTDACALFSISGGDSYSVRFADGDVKNKGATQFKVSNPTTEGSCVPCGNGVLDAGEQCDPVGSACGGGGALCQSDCTCPCDSLDTSECLFPFPSDYLTKTDVTTDTGKRVHFATATMPVNASAVPIVAADYNLNDGFSPGATILLRIPGVDLAQTGAAPITDIERSLDAGAPVVLVNASTLAHQLMFVEQDANAAPATQATIIHPAINLDLGERYIVALRQIKDAGGGVIAPSATFLAYRDNTPTGDPVLEARRAHMEELFTTLAAAGVPRNDLYLAWDFTVASQRNLSERMLFVRDDAFSRLGTSAPAFTVDTVLDEVDAKIFRRVTGTFQVDRYVDNTVPPARFVLDANGIPVHQATTQPASFICNIPRAAMANIAAAAVPARAAIYGHGLLGSNTEVSSGNVESMADEHNFVFCATKWIGMSNDDVGQAIATLQDLGKFPTLTDRLQQSMLNQLFLARLMIHANGFTADAAFKDSFGAPVIDTSAVFYDGNSQGGIFGGMVMIIAQDITRGALGVPGMNYALLLTRSTDFAGYAGFLNPAYTNQLQRPLVLGLIQMLWDRSDPSGLASHMTTDPLPNTPPHEVLLHLAFGDHQVSNVATEIEARTIGASIHTPAIAPARHTDVNPYFGIPAIPSYPFNGSALVVWDSGAAAPPTSNVAPSMGADPHSDPRNSVNARLQKSEFLKIGGAVVDVCSGLPCVAP
ncbi:MAG: hypothetical protein ABI629_11530 [bacterium]